MISKIQETTHSINHTSVRRSCKRFLHFTKSSMRKKGNRLFDFDKHHALSRAYCHRQTENNKGDFALWHTPLFTTSRCSGASACSDATIYKSLLQCKSIHALQHRYASACTECDVELQILAARAKTKTAAAKRIATILHTNLVSQW